MPFCFGGTRGLHSGHFHPIYSSQFKQIGGFRAPRLIVGREEVPLGVKHQGIARPGHNGIMPIPTVIFCAKCEEGVIIVVSPAVVE